MGDSKIQKSVQVKNRRAFFDYEIDDKYDAGIVLKGTEIKSIRQGKVSFTDGYVFISKGEAYIKGMHISPYTEASFANHDPDRQKKLLLQKREIEKLIKKTEEKGFTIIPLRLYINDRGFAKVQIGVGKGKKVHDKRESLKEKDAKRQMNKF